MKRYDKSEVQFESPAQGMDHCRNCQHFLPDRNQCNIVRGKILPGDWCSKFVAISRIASALRRKE